MTTYKKHKKKNRMTLPILRFKKIQKMMNSVYNKDDKKVNIQSFITG